MYVYRLETNCSASTGDIFPSGVKIEKALTPNATTFVKKTKKSILINRLMTKDIVINSQT